MATDNSLTGLVQQLRRRCGDGPADGDLLADFAMNRDEAAFAELVERHGGLVLRVARRHLPDRQAAEDVVQATFLALARNARRLGRPPSLVNWLYTVALRQARKTRVRFARRTALLSRVPPPVDPIDPLAEVSGRELVTIIDDELIRLPTTYRLPLLLCALEGLSREEAARRLGWPIGSVKGRLERGRELLRARLAKRGLTVPAVLAGGLLAVPAEALPAAMVAAVTRAAVAVPAGGIMARTVLAVLTVAGLGVGIGAAVWPGPRPDGPAVPPPAPVAAAAEQRTDRYGDPLPAGAVARFGTVRLRHSNEIRQIAFSADSKVLATAGMDGAVCLWDTATGRELRRLNGATSGGAPGVAFSPDGKVLATSQYQDVRRWDAASDRELPKVRAESVVAGQLTFSPDGKILACRGHKDSGQGRQNVIVFLDAASGRELHRLEELTNYVAPSFAFSPDSATWTYADKKTNDIHLYDSRTGKLIRKFAGHNQPASTVAFSPDGKTLASTEWGSGVLRFWETATSKLLPMIGNLRSVENLEFSPDGKLLVGGGGGLRPELWDMAAGHLLPEHLEKQRDRCEVAVFSPDGKLLAAVYQHTVYLWDVATGKAVRPLQGHEREVSAITFAPDGMTAVSVAGETGVVRRWMVATGQELPNVGKVRDMVYAAAYSPDGRFLAAGTGNHDGTIWLLDAITGQEIRRLVVPGGYVTSIAISADSKTLVSRAFGREIHVWDVESGRDVRQFPGSPQGHMNIALSPDGHTVADGDQSGVVHLWETATGKELRHFDGHREIATIAFSPNGRLLASGGGDEVRLWDSTTGKELRQLAGHKNWVQSVAFSPDGRTLVSVGVNQPVRIWEVASGKERRRYEGHHGGNRTVTFSRDGRRLATGGDDTTVLVWDVTGLAEAGSLPRLAPTPEQLTELWADLAHEDAARAGRAIWSLVAGAERAMPFLRDRLRPVTTADRRQTARWIADLDSNTFAIRQTATRELEALGESSGPALAEVAKSGKSAEVRQRAEQLLQRLRDREGTAEGLRELRAVEVLEQIGTSAARKHLEALAGGAAGATLTGAAAEALQRLQAR